MKKLYLIFLVIIIIVFSSSSTFAKGEVDPIKEGMPGLDKVYNEEFNNNDFMTDYRDNYTLDTNFGNWKIDDLIDQQIDKVNNVLFMLQKNAVDILIMLYDKALNFSAYELFDNLLENLIGGLYKSTFGTLSLILISLLSVFFMIKYFQGKQAEVWGGLLKTLLIIAIAFMYFTNPLFFAKRIEVAINEITGLVLTANEVDYSAPSYIAENRVEEEPLVQVANNLWEQYVHKPWQVAEFGNKEIADKYTEDILKLKPGSDEREDLIKVIEKESGTDTIDMLTKRLGFILIYYIPLMINILVLALMCFLVMSLQFVVMLVFLLGAFVFLLALFPSFGSAVIKNWLSTLLSIAGFKIIMAFLLMVLLAFNDALYATAETEGWVYALIVQLAIYIVLFFFRDKIINIFMVFGEVVKNPVASVKSLSNYGSVLHPSKGANSSFKRDMLKPFKSIKNDSITAKKKVVGATRKVKTTVQKTQQDFKKYADNQTKNHNYMSQYEDAKKYLDKKHKFHKKNAQNKKREANNFVKEVDSRANKGKDKFTKNDIDSVIKRQKKRDEYLEKRKQREIKRKENIDDYLDKRSKRPVTNYQNRKLDKEKYRYYGSNNKKGYKPGQRGGNNEKT
jgi:hypothetical protein